MATSEVPEERYIAKPGAKSTVWNFFGLRRDTNGKAMDDGTAFCKSCNKGVVAKLKPDTVQELVFLSANI